MSSHGFSEMTMRSRLASLSAQTDSIQTLSMWLLHHQNHHSDLIVSTWLKEIRNESRTEKLISLVYLANDVIQNSRKKCPSFMPKFFSVLEPAFRYCAKLPAPELHSAIGKVIKVFNDRQIYPPDMIARLETAAQGKKPVYESSIVTTPKTPVKEIPYDEDSVKTASNDVLHCIRKLLTPASEDAEIRHKLAACPPIIANPNLLNSLRTGEEVKAILSQIEEIEPLAADYSRKLTDEMQDRKNLDRYLENFTGNLRAAIDNFDKLLREVKRKEDKVRADLESNRRGFDSLPDFSTEMISQMTLPSAEKLFNMR